MPKVSYTLKFEFYAIVLMSDILRHLCQMACQTKQGGLPTINHPQEDLEFALELLNCSLCLYLLDPLKYFN